MPIIPDVKDWTWVVNERCPECSFDPSTVTPATVPGAIQNLLPRWRAVLRGPDVAERPDANTWSPLEYACHVRDLFSVFSQRLALMLSVDNAEFANWDQDAAAVEKAYADSDPAVVSAELTAEGEQIMEDFARVQESDWARRGLRSNGSEFTVLTFSRYFLHDVVHHLHDVKG